MDNKRKEEFIWQVTAIICAIIILGICIGVSIRNSIEKEYTYYNKDIKYNSNISRTTDEPINDYKEVTLTISPFEKAEITAEYKRKIGNINIKIIDKLGNNILREEFTLTNQEENEKTIEINPGNGEYKILVDTTDFIGSYNVKWNVKSLREIKEVNSSKGYRIKYNSSIFNYSETDEHDIYTIKFSGEENEIINDNVYMKVSIKESNDIESVQKETFINEDALINYCKICDGKYDGKYSKEEMSIDGINYFLYKFVVPVEENKILLIEESFDDNDVLKYNAENQFNAMLNSITIKK